MHTYSNESFHPDIMQDSKGEHDTYRPNDPYDDTTKQPPVQLKSVLEQIKMGDSPPPPEPPAPSTFCSRVRDACMAARHLPTHAWHFLLGSRAEPIMGLFCLGFYMPMPFVQNLMMEKVCMQKYPRELCLNATGINETIESENQDIVGQYLLYHYLARQLPAVILALLMGNWSDVYGRRYMIVLPIVGNIATFILYILNAHYEDWPPEAIIFSGVPAGLTGDYAGFMLGLFGFIKDVHPLLALSLRISLADGTEMLASQIGPLIGAQLYDRFGYNSMFGLGIGFLVVNIGAAYILIKDHGFKQASLRVKLHDFFQPKGIKQSVRSVFIKRPGNKRAYIFVVLFTVAIVFFGYFGHSEIIYMYTRIKLKWNVNDIANYNAIIGGCSTAGLIFLLPTLLYLLKMNDVTMGLVGQLGFLAFYLGTAFATTSAAMYAVCVFQIVAQMGFVTLRSCISKCVDNSEIGRVMSIYAVLQAAFRVLGQTIATQIYLATKDIYIGTYFILSGGIFIFSMTAYFWMNHDMKKRGHHFDEYCTEPTEPCKDDIDQTHPIPAALTAH